MGDKSGFITVLRVLAKLLPGDHVRTMVYLNCIARPRKLLRLSLNSFYRMDHIYEVLSEFKNTYKGSFSMLEFGVGSGYSFTKKLYATKYLKMEDRVIVHGFDSFEGLPETSDYRDQDLVANDGWVKGQFKENYEELYEYCRKHYRNFELHRGWFDKTITEEFLKGLRTFLPILIWIDCDYYTSARTVFEPLIPYIPSGCVIYFDEYEFNFGSRFTGEARIVYEINHGLFGEGIEMVLDSPLSLNSQRVYRFINLRSESQYERFVPSTSADSLKRRLNDSPLP